MLGDVLGAALGKGSALFCSVFNVTNVRCHKRSCVIACLCVVCGIKPCRRCSLLSQAASTRILFTRVVCHAWEMPDDSLISPPVSGRVKGFMAKVRLKYDSDAHFKQMVDLAETSLS